MSDMCIQEKRSLTEALDKRVEERWFVEKGRLVFVFCIALWLISAVGKWCGSELLLGHQFFFSACFWSGSFLLAGLGIEQIQVIRKLKNELNEICSKNQELEAKMQLMQKQKIDLEYLMQVRHDVRGQFSSLMGLAQLGRLEEIKEYLASVFDNLASVDDYPSGVSPVLSIVIGQIRKEARENGIDFDYHMTSQDLGLKLSDITVLFFNILENALEGAKASGQEKAYIDLQIKREKNKVYIRCVNSTDSGMLIERGGQYKTTKQKKENHGLGIPAIKKTLRYYHGNVAMIVEEGCFILTAEYECEGVG